jgi:hypothetical protein
MTGATRAGLAAAAILTCGATAFGQEGDRIPFPGEYRRWAHVKSALVGPESAAAATDAGIHHVYANEKALEGYVSGRFPDGSILVYDLLETKEVRGNTIEGRQRRVDVMVKGSPRYRDTGGWGFASFAGSERNPQASRPDCFSCHKSRESHDYVFSEFRSPGSLDDVEKPVHSPGAPR